MLLTEKLVDAVDGKPRGFHASTHGWVLLPADIDWPGWSPTDELWRARGLWNENDWSEPAHSFLTFSEYRAISSSRSGRVYLTTLCFRLMNSSTFSLPWRSSIFKVYGP